MDAHPASAARSSATSTGARPGPARRSPPTTPSTTPRSCSGSSPRPAPAGRRARDHRARRRRLALRGVQAALRPDAGLRLGVDPRLPRRDPRQQRRASSRARPRRRRSSSSSATRSTCRWSSSRTSPGYMVGREAEAGGIIKKGSQMLNAVANSTVPHLTVIVGSSYGAGTYGMSRARLRQPLHLPLAHGQDRGDGAQADRRGHEPGPSGRAPSAAARPSTRPRTPSSSPRSRRPRSRGSLALAATSAISDDGIIDPRDTRTVLGLCLSAVRSAPGRGRARLRGLPPVSAIDCSSPTAARSRAGSSGPRGPWGSAPSRSTSTPTPTPRTSPTPTRRCASADLAYLDADALLDAARGRGAEAVHPGYGYLAENAAFADAVEAAGLRWVGPPPETIAAMGDKLAAKRAGRRARAWPRCPRPRTPRDAADRRLSRCWSRPRPAAAARACASSSAPTDLAEAIAAASREAERAFGDDRVFLERYVARARHVEVQMLGDRHGNLVHLGERECSIQRRHQKLIEEAPSPARRRGLRAALGDAALALARRLGYQLGRHRRVPARRRDARVLLPGGQHPAAGRAPGDRGGDRPGPRARADRGRLRRARSSFTQADVTLSGWAIEARLCAEDPAAGFLPATGTLAAFEPARRARGALGVRRRGRVGRDHGVRPHAGQGHRPRADAPRGRVAPGPGARAAPPRGRHDQPRLPGRHPAAPGIPRRRHDDRLHRAPRAAPGPRARRRRALARGGGRRALRGRGQPRRRAGPGVTAERLAQRAPAAPEPHPAPPRPRGRGRLRAPARRRVRRRRRGRGRGARARRTLDRRRGRRGARAPPRDARRRRPLRPDPARHGRLRGRAALRAARGRGGPRRPQRPDARARDPGARGGRRAGERRRDPRGDGGDEDGARHHRAARRRRRRAPRRPRATRSRAAPCCSPSRASADGRADPDRQLLGLLRRPDERGGRDGRGRPDRRPDRRLAGRAHDADPGSEPVRRSGVGYARTFLTQMEQVLGACVERGIKRRRQRRGPRPARLRRGGRRRRPGPGRERPRRGTSTATTSWAAWATWPRRATRSSTPRPASPSPPTAWCRPTPTSAPSASPRRWRAAPTSS